MVDFERKLVLAPLAGVTDSIYRLICRRHGADITWSEMVSAEGLVYSWEKNRFLLDFNEEERPLGIQLFGSDPGVMARAAASVARLRPDFIDLNFACPVKKVVRKNGGASLMRDPALIGRITSAAVAAAADIPVTAKIRSGWNEVGINYLEVGRILVESGAAAVCIHPRTRVQGFSGHSNWDHLARLVADLPVPVIGSGDVFEPEDAGRMFAQTGCTAVMIGRGVLGNPWLFSRTRAVLDGRPDPGGPHPREKLELALEHARMTVAQRGEPHGVVVMRKHFASYTRGLQGGAELRRRLFAAVSLHEVEQLFESYLEELGCVRC
ncbi:MAG: tRNA dihydrouridine synthase DusB [Candidatus Glassbacteria bacterium]|nr:tRNA dihydrouridine synthase DusB [Candidatus Glassbacteria bacterium]